MLELTIYAGREVADPLGDFLLGEGALCCTALDADAGTEREAPMFGEPGLEPGSPAWNHTALSVLVDEDFDWEAALKKAGQVFGSGKIRATAPSRVPDTDWVRVTQAAFQPIHASRRLWIVPSWSEPPAPDAVNISLDPGVAFGTGSHPTTRLCLAWLDENTRPTDTVLDYGCGTGILAISASLLGARSVAGVDLDPLAVEAARLNADKNRVEAVFSLPGGDPVKGQKYSIVVANILCNPLIGLAGLLCSLLEDGGRLLLSGILADQAPKLIEAYQAADPRVRLSVWGEEEGWVALGATKA